MNTEGQVDPMAQQEDFRATATGAQEEMAARVAHRREGLLQEVARPGTGCEKWDGLAETFGRPDLISMWVADMDFAAPEPVLDALAARVAHGAFGYQQVPETWKDAIVQWDLHRHRNKVDPEWIRYAPGVVPALFWLVNALTEPGEACLIQTPVYYPFRYAVEETGRRLITHDLVNDNGTYHIDFAGFETAIVQHRVKLFILCSPHNPVGRVWEKEELRQLWRICDRHGVFVLSDEIHRDLVLGARPHIPTAQVAENTERLITLASASKTFNLASLSNSFMFIPDRKVRARFDEAVKRAHPGSGNILGYVATEAAFMRGEPWLEALLAQLRKNASVLWERLSRDLPEAVISPLEGTYLQWVDLRKLLPFEQVEPFMRDVCRVAVDYGDWFGKAGEGFIRLNLATPQWRVEEVAERLIAGARQVRGRY